MNFIGRKGLKLTHIAGVVLQLFRAAHAAQDGQHPLRTGGDLAEIRRAESCGDLQTEAQAEIENGTQPEITVDVDSLDEYEVIFVGYPIWWNESPAMISTFLASCDFDGKAVAPFCTSVYSPIDNSLHIFEKLAPDAILEDGLTANDLNDVEPWLDELGVLAS